MLVDLHCHTTSSDGFLTPSELLLMAEKTSLEYIAITDHDTMSGFEEAYNYKKKNRLMVNLIKGVELGVKEEGSEVHVLGLKIEEQDNFLKQKLSFFRRSRQERMHKIIDKLNLLGYKINIADVLATSEGTASYGRPHIAKALIEKGYFNNISDIFKKLLYYNGPAYVEYIKPTLKEAVEMIQRAGGYSFIAHPYKIKNQKILLKAVAEGIDGIEVYYPFHTPEMIKKYLCFAKKHSLKISGGSDFHGIKGRYPSKLGIYNVSADLLNLW